MTPLEKFLEKSKELKDKSTRVVSWYAHESCGDAQATVRGPYGRWLECSEVTGDYKSQVSSADDDCKFAAHAMNTSETKDEIIRVLAEALEMLTNDGIWHRKTRLRLINITLAKANELADRGLP